MLNIIMKIVYNNIVLYYITNTIIDQFELTHKSYKMYIHANAEMH